MISTGKIAAAVDHTLLAPDATWEQIRTLCDEAVHWHVASVCIPPCFVLQAREYLGGAMRICTVVGFPNGYTTTAVKQMETREAVENGADEIDMVINLGWLKEGRFDDIAREIALLKQAAQGRTLKVIVETCLLTDDEKVRMCEVVTQAGADYIKTSTGFSHTGATAHDVALLARSVGPGIQVKAAGGISTLEDARRFLDLGASRLGSSRLVALLEQEKARA